MFEMIRLPYDYNALEPFIDAATVEIHYTKHHKKYLDNLNIAIANYQQFNSMSVEEILSNTDNLPSEIKQAVINNGGGYYNHNLYWENMAPKFKIVPEGKLMDSITAAFTSFADFQKLFSESAIRVFGSGWTWLAINKNKDLKILNTSNQDTPLNIGYKPLLALDVWEHAYYLKYQNRRQEYIENWWNIVNWKVVAKRLETELA